MKSILFLTCLLFFSLKIGAQETFDWKNLKLGTTDITEAVSVLGKPKKDKIESPKYDKNISAVQKSQLNWRRLKSEKLDEFEEVHLLFLNEKLFSIDLIPQKGKMQASSLGEFYKSNFLFLEGLSKQMNLGDYEGQKETTIPKVYPTTYFMLNVKQDRIILATIDNDSWKAIWRDGVKKPTLEMFPGNVRSIKIMTRDISQK